MNDFPACEISNSLFLGNSVLLLGSGGLRIGQAGEFDYSGSQALKALKAAGLRTILVNPNIATVQTDSHMADVIYLEPLTVSSLEQIIQKEKPSGILLGFGGQTALNLGLKLEAQGILEKYQVQVLGTSVDAIRQTEDRELFKQALENIQIKTPRSISVTTVEDAIQAAEQIQYPIMMRSAYSLGGLGSGKIHSQSELIEKTRACLSAVPQILIEEYLLGWKEFEYEIVRDCQDHTLTICNMENLDPMGVHTGESIVIAPAQTLNNTDHQQLRSLAIKIARHFKIIGECNVQFSVNPKNGDYRVIELNPRLSRSSALASKATGYPLAWVAAQLALGKLLKDIRNTVTQTTCAYFEPALDYVVIKIPRWDTHKLKAERTIGTEMKSVGEVMAIGRSFAESLQKAVGMLNIGASCLADFPECISDPKLEIKFPTDRRLFALYAFFYAGGSIEEAHRLSQIDIWFLSGIFRIAQFARENKLQTRDAIWWRQAKQLGFSDKVIAKWVSQSEEQMRAERLSFGVFPVIKQIDTLAGECDAKTNYLYLTYHGEQHDILPSQNPAIVVLGSGPYAIGQSVEFDWCAVNTLRALKKINKTAIVINSNPETVSTDYDESDRLYFEQLTLERIQDIAEFENIFGFIVSVGGQIANNLALPLAKAGFKLLGTPADSIDQAENRERFSKLLNQLEIDQPSWETVASLEQAKAFSDRVGYPVLIRPSYILSGAAMNVAYDSHSLSNYLNQATNLSKEHPVVISKFILEAKELEMDGVANQGDIIIEAISEHIENAGVHSGDASIVLPPQRLYLETIRQTKKITKKIVKALNITGPFNLQLIAKNNAIQVIECNVRASRSFPFVSKVTNHNFIEIATQVMLDCYQQENYETLELDCVAVKVPQFSYHRFKGADPVAHVEMASTGEVACMGDSLSDAYLRAWLATEQTLAGKRLLLSVGDPHKEKLLPYLKKLEEKGWRLISTLGTHEFLVNHGVGSYFVYKAREEETPNIRDAIMNHEADLIINIPSKKIDEIQTDGFVIRRLAIDHHLPLITDLQNAMIMLQCLLELPYEKLPVCSWQERVGG